MELNSPSLVSASPLQRPPAITNATTAEWPHFMVAAALKFASYEKAPVRYTTSDEARLDILNTLNWYEAHSEYEWPNFLDIGFDFSQAMRLWRALVNDVFVALQKAGNVRVSDDLGAFATPDSGIVRATKRSVAGKSGIV